MYDIRPAEPKDIPQLANLVCLQFEYQQTLAPFIELIPGVDWTRYVAQRLRRRNAQMLVAEKDGNLVGYIDFRVAQQGWTASNKGLMTWARRLKHIFTKEPVSIFQARRYGFIEDIYVDPSVRLTAIGLGVKLFNRSLQWFENQGVREVEGAISVGNHTSHKFFQRMGCQPIKYLMRKTL